MAKTKRPPALGYQELRAQVREGQCKRLYVLYGEETFLIEKLTEALSELLIEPGSRDLDRVVFHGDGQPGKIDLNRLKAEIQTPPFLSRRKLIIIHNSAWLTLGGGRKKADQDDEEDSTAGGSAQADRQAALLDIFGLLTDYVCLVMIEDKVDRRQKKLISQIEDSGVLAEIGRQPAKLLQAWVEAECRRRQLQIEPLAAESLIDRCDASMQVIWQELSKIFLYCTYAGQERIDRELIAELALPDLRGSVFDLTDALSAGRTEQALTLLDTLIGQKQPVQLIAFMLARHLRQLICAAELKRPDTISAKLRVMPFVARRLSQQARHFSLPVLEGLYGRCYETDLMVKSGKISDRLGLETLIITAAETARDQQRR